MDNHKPYEEMTDAEFDAAADEFEATHSTHVIEQPKILCLSKNEQ